MKRNFLLLLLAVFAFSSCDNDSNQPREVHPFIKGLEGLWVTDTLIHYDNEWNEIESIIIENGWSNFEGASSGYYTFKSDGTLTLSYIILPDGWVDKWSCCPCFYNEESKIITVKKQDGETLREYLISDYDGEYLVLDYTEHLYDSYKHYYRYVRETLKRRQE